MFPFITFTDYPFAYLYAGFFWCVCGEGVRILRVCFQDPGQVEVYLPEMI